MSALLDIRGLTVGYGAVRAVVGVDLELPAGCLGALVGPSGCGKSTLLRAIAGFERPLAGSIRIGGRRVAGDGVWVPPERRRVGMLFQDGALFPHLDVWANVRYGVRGDAAGEHRAREALAMVGMTALGDRFPDELSGGERQRVALARALAPEPRLVLLDEPFAALDTALRDQVRGEVVTILRRAGTTALLVTHDQQEALALAERVAVMAAGEILQCGAPAEIYAAPASETVARLVGGGRLVACTVAGGGFSSALGRAECSAPDGPGRALVRAEDLEILPAGEPRGERGRVVGRQFLGPDELVRIELDAGGCWEVRRPSRGAPAAVTGERVRLALRPGPYAVFAGPGPAPPAGDVAQKPRE